MAVHASTSHIISLRRLAPFHEFFCQYGIRALKAAIMSAHGHRLLNASEVAVLFGMYPLRGA